MTDKNKLPGTLLFLFAGLVCGLGFGLLTSTETVRHDWFVKIEYWLVPRWPYWVSAGVALLLGLAGSYLLASKVGWVARAHSLPRVVLAALLISLAVPTTVLLTTILTSQIGPIMVLIAPCIIAAVAASAMWVFSQKWCNAIAALMVLAGLLTIPLASIVSLFSKLSNEAYDTIKFTLGYSLLSALCGYWLIKARSDKSRNAIQ